VSEERVVLRVPVLCYSRIVGYYAPTVNWNVGKRAEFSERVPFNVSEVVADAQP
jgi:anaerobic ribonucleoside-triphosphate reductase